MQLLYAFRRAARRTRRRLGGSSRFRILSLAVVLAVLFGLHTAAMVGLEGLSVGEAAWLTVTTATTVGYGDLSAGTPAGRWATVLLMYVGGIFVLAQLAGLVFEATQARLERQRYGKVALDVRDHVVIVGWRRRYVTRVIAEVRGSITALRDAEIVIVSPTLATLPDDLPRGDVHHVNGDLDREDILARANPRHAARIAILPEGDDEGADLVNLALLARLRRLAPGVPVLLAARNPEAQTLAGDLGATDAIAFDANYPDVCARALLAVGAEGVIDDLLDRSGAELLQLELPLVTTVGEVLAATIAHGTLLGLRLADGDYLLHPPTDRAVRGEALVFLADTGDDEDAAAARGAIAEALAPLRGDVAAVRAPRPRSVGVFGTARRLRERYLRRVRRELPGVDVHVLGEGDPLQPDGIGAATEDAPPLGDFDTLVLMASPPTAPSADAGTYLLIDALRRRRGYRGRIIAEAVSRANRRRLLDAGATDILRPAVRNPTLLARCIAIGAEELLDDLYSSGGQTEFIGVSVELREPWAEFVTRAYPVGVAIAFAGAGGRAVVLPAGDYVGGEGVVYLVVDTERYRSERAVRAALG